MSIEVLSASNIYDTLNTVKSDTLSRIDELCGNLNITNENINTLINMNLDMDGSLIKYIKNPTVEQALIAVQSDGVNIKYIKNPTIDVMIEAVKNNGLALEYINLHDIKTQSEKVKVCEYAIENDPDAIRTIDPKYGIEQLSDNYRILCDMAVRKQWSLFKDYADYVSEDTIFDAISYDASNITYVKYKSDEFIEKAINVNARVIRYIEQTPERCLLACSKWGNVLEDVQPEFHTDEVVIAAINNVSHSFTYTNNRSYDVCVAAINKNMSNILYVYKSDQTNEICEYFIRNCPHSYWKGICCYIKNNSFKITCMKILKFMGFYKVNRDKENK